MGHKSTVNVLEQIKLIIIVPTNNVNKTKIGFYIKSLSNVLFNPPD